MKTLTRDRRTIVGEFLRMRWLRRCAGFLLGIMHAGYCARMPAKRCSKVCAESHAGTPEGRKCGLGVPQGLPKTAKLSLRDAKCGQDASKSVLLKVCEPLRFFLRLWRLLRRSWRLSARSWGPLGGILGGSWEYFGGICGLFGSYVELGECISSDLLKS